MIRRTWGTRSSTCSQCLDSQGDAGQFRTPRHIIDFMVAVLDPKKDDVRCWTRPAALPGSSSHRYKHIMAANSGEDGHSALTRLTTRERLATLT